MEEHYCFYCGAIATDTFQLEKHHPFGKANHDLTVEVCKNCHHIITMKQNQLSPRYFSQKATQNEKFSFSRFSLGAHLEQLGKELQRQEKDNYEENNGHRIRPRSSGKVRNTDSETLSEE